MRKTPEEKEKIRLGISNDHSLIVIQVSIPQFPICYRFRKKLLKEDSIWNLVRVNVQTEIQLPVIVNIVIEVIDRFLLQKDRLFNNVTYWNDPYKPVSIKNG